MSPMRKKFYQGDRRDLPGRAPQKALWFDPEFFRPWRIDDDPGFRNLSIAEKHVYDVMCRKSYLAKNIPRRRYVAITHEELARLSHCSKRTVIVAVKKILKSRLALRWHKGTTDSGGSRYELPASLNQIKYWRINYKPKKDS